MEEILCSSDPDSLDALILPEWKVSIADGTAPHILEPRYPAVSESILSFGDFLDPIKLKPHSETIRQINRLISKNYTQATSLPEIFRDAPPLPHRKGCAFSAPFTRRA